jgi:hypothetical protein
MSILIRDRGIYRSERRSDRTTIEEKAVRVRAAKDKRKEGF